MNNLNTVQKDTFSREMKVEAMEAEYNGNFSSTCSGHCSFY